MKTLTSSIATALLIAFAAAGNAQAAEDTQNFQVRITITESCEFSSAATDVDFGTRARSAAGNADATGSLVVNCTVGTPYRIGLNQGTHGDSVSSRLMQRVGGTETIPYNLYRDAARTANWGNTADADTLAGTGNGTNQNIPVYGRVAGDSNLNVPAGNYLDTVTATITY